MHNSVLENVQAFLWWVACTDAQAIRLCSPVTRFYQTTAGLMILITGVLAFISGTYAIIQVVGNLTAAVLLGSIYATAIFSIDRYIVSTRGGRITWFRLPLALLLGCVMAVPLELRLFENRIDKELVRQYQGENQSLDERRHRERDAVRSRIADLERGADDYRRKINEWGAAMEAEVVGRVKVGATGLAGEGPAYRAAAIQKQVDEDLLRQVTAELDRVRAQEGTILKEIDAEYQRSVIPQSYDLLSRYEAMHAIEREHPEALKMSWALTLVLIMIEIFPALTKVTMPYTAYSALVEAREREDIQRTHSFGNQNLHGLPLSPDDHTLFVISQTETVRQQQAEERQQQTKGKVA